MSKFSNYSPMSTINIGSVYTLCNNGYFPEILKDYIGKKCTVLSFTNGKGATIEFEDGTVADEVITRCLFNSNEYVVAAKRASVIGDFVAITINLSLFKNNSSGVNVSSNLIVDISFI